MPRISDLGAATTPLAGTEKLAAVQVGTKGPLVSEINTFVHANPPAGVSNTVTVTGEHWFTADNELDYSASFTDGMSATTVTFTELPTTTIAVCMLVELADLATTIRFNYKRASGDTQDLDIFLVWADGGTNRFHDTVWMPTFQNTLHAVSLQADATSNFLILGYKTGA